MNIRYSQIILIITLMFAFKAASQAGQLTPGAPVRAMDFALVQDGDRLLHGSPASPAGSREI
jgi:hypothetical protein